MSNKSFVQSVGFLAIMEIIGICIAFALIPLLNLVYFDTSIFDSESGIEPITSFWDIIIGWFPDNWSSLLAGTSVIISVVLLAWAIGLSLKKLDNNGNETVQDVVKFIELFYNLLKGLVKWVLYLVPFTVFSIIPTILFGEAISSWGSLGALIGIALLGLLIVIIVQFFIVTLVQGKKFPKTFVKNIIPSWTTAILTRSSIAAFPQHSEALVKSNIDESVASSVPALGSSMGLSICAGMYPAMISLITLNLTKTPDTNLAISYVLIFIVIFLTSFGVAGVPGAFDATAVSALSSAGLSTALVPLVLVLEPILDPLRTVGNVNSASTAAIIMDKVIKRRESKSQKKKDINSDKINYDHINPNAIDHEEYELAHIAKDEKKIYTKNKDKNQVDLTKKTSLSKAKSKNTKTVKKDKDNNI